MRYSLLLLIAVIPLTLFEQRLDWLHQALPGEPVVSAAGPVASPLEAAPLPAPDAIVPPDLLAGPSDTAYSRPLATATVRGHESATLFAPPQEANNDSGPGLPDYDWDADTRQLLAEQQMALRLSWCSPLRDLPPPTPTEIAVARDQARTVGLQLAFRQHAAPLAAERAFLKLPPRLIPGADLFLNRYAPFVSQKATPPPQPTRLWIPQPAERPDPPEDLRIHW